MTDCLPVIPYNCMTVLHFTHVTYINVIMSDLPVIGYADDRHCAGQLIGKKGCSSLWRLLGPKSQGNGTLPVVEVWGFGGLPPEKFSKFTFTKVHFPAF